MNNTHTPHINPIQAWAFAFGCSVGWGAFVMPGTTFLPLAGPLGTLIGMILGILVMLIISSNYHFMMNRDSSSGGAYSYVKAAFGFDHAFVCAWFLLLAYASVVWANATAITILVRNLYGATFQFGFHYNFVGYDIYFGECLLSVCAILLFGSLCLLGKRISAIVQTVMAILLFLGIITFFVASRKIGNGIEDFKPFFFTGKNPVRQILSIIALIPWAFVGLESISHSTEDFNFSAKKSFPIMTIASVMAAIAYILLVGVACVARPQGVQSWLDLIHNLDSVSIIPSLFVANKGLGNSATLIICITIISATGTGILGMITATSRILFSMSKDSVLPKWFSKTTKQNTPKNAIIFVMLISLVIPFLGRTSIGWLIDVATIGATIAYGYTSASTFKIALKENNKLFSITGAVGIVLSILFTFILLIPKLISLNTLSTESYLMLTLWSILGFIILRKVFVNDSERRFGKSTVTWLALLFLIFFTSSMWTREMTDDITEDLAQNISSFYKDELQARGALTSQEREDIEIMHLNFLMKNAKTSIQNNGIIQVFILLVAILIMLDVYSILHTRERQLEKDKDIAEKNNKAKSVFLANMSHDIRTPMNAIIGFTDLAIKHSENTEQVLSHLKKIKTASTHLLALINDILEMSRIESGKVSVVESDVNLNDLISELKTIIAGQAEAKKQTLEIKSVNMQNPCVISDKLKLNQVMINLISNAIKYTPENGDIKVIIEQKGIDDKYGIYCISVKDNGIGMSKEFAAKVFEEFEREQTSTISGIQGTGLGLSITKKIVELLGGTISVQTEQGKGSEFIVNIKLKLGEQKSNTEETMTDKTSIKINSQSQSDAYEKQRILLVDDIDLNRELASFMLQEAGYLVEEAVNGHEAVEKLAASKPGWYAAVLMDIQMPILNGYEASKQIRELKNKELASIPIVALTANAFEEDVQAAKRVGMNAHLAKPLDIQALIKTLNQVIPAK